MECKKIFKLVVFGWFQSARCEHCHLLDEPLSIIKNELKLFIGQFLDGLQIALCHCPPDGFAKLELPPFRDDCRPYVARLRQLEVHVAFSDKRESTTHLRYDTTENGSFVSTNEAGRLTAVQASASAVRAPGIS